jgi:hypothetical protein
LSSAEEKQIVLPRTGGEIFGWHCLVSCTQNSILTDSIG